MDKYKIAFEAVYQFAKDMVTSKKSDLYLFEEEDVLKPVIHAKWLGEEHAYEAVVALIESMKESMEL